MFTEIVLFDLAGDQPDLLERIRASEALARPAAGLLHTRFLHDEPARSAGMAYIWSNRDAADAGHDLVWLRELTETLGTPRITGICSPDTPEPGALFLIDPLAA